MCCSLSPLGAIVHLLPLPHRQLHQEGQASGDIALPVSSPCPVAHGPWSSRAGLRNPLVPSPPAPSFVLHFNPRWLWKESRCERPIGLHTTQLFSLRQPSSDQDRKSCSRTVSILGVKWTKQSCPTGTPALPP